MQLKPSALHRLLAGQHVFRQLRGNPGLQQMSELSVLHVRPLVQHEPSGHSEFGSGHAVRPTAANPSSAAAMTK
jgi:hypothetical protein